MTSYNRTRSGTLTGPRPPTARRSSSSPSSPYDTSESGDGDDDEMMNAEEGSIGSNINTYHAPRSTGDVMSKRGLSSNAMVNGASNGIPQEGTEWDELVLKMADVVRRWKLLIANQGMQGYEISKIEFSKT